MAQNGMDDYDPFQEIDEADTEYARPRPVNTLTPGQEYKVTHILQMRSQYQDSDKKFPMNTIVQYFDEKLKFQSILPRKFNNKSQHWINAMNKLIANNVGPKVVYYGTVSMSYEVDLLRHTQQPDAGKLQVVQRIMAKTTPKKGDGNSPTPSPSKRTIDNNNGETGETPAKVPRN